MKKDLHPANYRPVVFKDMSNGDMFLSRVDKFMSRSARSRK